jgi:hypothetical protein
VPWFMCFAPAGRLGPLGLQAMLPLRVTSKHSPPGSDGAAASRALDGFGVAAPPSRRFGAALLIGRVRCTAGSGR